MARECVSPRCSCAEARSCDEGTAARVSPGPRAGGLFRTEFRAQPDFVFLCNSARQKQNGGESRTTLSQALNLH